MIKIFGATDKNYTSNGDIVLQSIKAINDNYVDDMNAYCERAKAYAKEVLGIE